MIVVDTSVWSLAFRRRASDRPEPPAVATLRARIAAGEPILLPGIVRQELLSGLRHEAQFDRLRAVTAPFKPLLATEEDHVEAARLVNACRRGGVQAGAVDALLVAMAMRLGATLMTTDADFLHMHAVVPFELEHIDAA